jgi:hypothetical protein
MSRASLPRSSRELQAEGPLVVMMHGEGPGKGRAMAPGVKTLVPKEKHMDASPKILLWNYSYEEMLQLDGLFQQVGAPEARAIEKGQGELTVHEILFTDSRSNQEFSSDERIMLFFNVPAPVIQTLMREIKAMDIPRPIFAVVTPQSIGWKFSELVEHLARERDYFQKRAAEEKKANAPLRKIEG